MSSKTSDVSRRHRGLFVAAAITTLLVGILGCTSHNSTGSAGDAKKPVGMLNVSYDPTRELYEEFNDSFVAHWRATEGQDVNVDMSHGGAGKQARAVMDGLDADVVTLALAYDIDVISQRAGLMPGDWQTRLPHNSCPYTSTIVFLVRKGNPKGIKDWGDLVKPDVKIITPHPKTSGGARWNYLAAWGYVLKKHLGDFTKLKDPAQKEAVAEAERAAQEFVTRMFRNVPVLDSGARGATMTFVERNLGDVLLAWENEALLSVHNLGPDKYEIVVPSISIVAEPPVCLMDKVADKHGTRKVAEAYLKYLYSPAGQRIVAKNYYRPVNPEGVPVDVMGQFPKVELFTIDEVFGGWAPAQKRHFDDGGVFDQIYKP